MATQPASPPSLSRYVLLSVGSDPILLATRTAVLRDAGYRVRAEMDIPKAIREFKSGDFDLLVLCHSIPERERRKIISAIRASAPSVPIIIMEPDGDTAKLADASVHSLDGPQALLDCVQRLLEARR